jgi:hypothetical protein
MLPLFNVLSDLRAQILSTIRRVLGTRNLIESRAHDEYALRRLWNRAVTETNARTWALAPPEELERSSLCKRARDVVRALSPLDIAESRYTRVGRQYDGGYVMLDHFPNTTTAAYSFGVSDDVTWDEQIADRGIPVFLYDHTIPSLPKTHPLFTFVRTGVCGFKRGKNLMTLEECLANNGHAKATDLLLKIDVEGCEWDVFAQTPIEVMQKFQQIVIEFHGLTGAVYNPNSFREVISVLEKINLTHQSVHVHGNCACITVAIRRLILPDLLEVTYVRRSDFSQRLVPNQRVFPTDIDQPTFAESPDIHLGRFQGDWD